MALYIFLNTLTRQSLKHWGNDCILKFISNIHWEEHAAATSAILESYAKIINVFENMTEDQSQVGETWQEAENISNSMKELEFIFTCWSSGMIAQVKLSKKTNWIWKHMASSVDHLLYTMRNDFKIFEGMS